MTPAEVHDFIGLCAFMATVRRRVSPYLGRDGFANIRGGLVELLSGISDTSTTDERVSAFCARFPEDSAHRFVRARLVFPVHEIDPLTVVAS